MEGPDQWTAAGRGHLRAARADRERVLDVLKTAFVQERLDQDELDARVGQALTARTYAELAALTADIPADPAAAGPPAAMVPRTPVQIMTRAACWSATCLIVAVILAIGGIVLLAPVPVLVAVGVLGQGITDALEARSSRGQLPPDRGRRRPDGPAGREVAAPDADAGQPGADRTGADRTGAEMRARRPDIPVRPGVRPAPGAACGRTWLRA